MAKYVIDIDFGDDDCSFCPFFVQHPHDAWCVYSDDERELTEELRDASDGVNKVWCFDRPDWCPLVSFEMAMAREWVESVNSQPSKDEPKEIIRVELYESEVDKLGGLAMTNKLNTAQMIAKLIDDYKIVYESTQDL